MRNIGRMNDASRARRFSDVLYARGIANDVREVDGAWALWVHDDARVDEAKVALDTFRERAADPAFADEAARGKSRRKEVHRKDEAYRARLALARQSMHGAGGRGWLTLTMLAVALVLFGCAYAGIGDVYGPLVLSNAPAIAGLPEVWRGQVWRLFTPVLLHGDFMHIGFNLLMWMSFGEQVEARKGLPFFALFVLTAAMVSNLGEYTWIRLTEPWRPPLVIGMSGVLYAAFGFVLTKGRIDPQDGLDVAPQTTWILLGWLVLCMTGLFGNIANAAHVTGLLWGVLWAWLDVGWFRFRKARR